MEITVYRDPPVASEARQLPAATYNLMHVLLARARGTLFVPIRTMQYLAIVDAEEVVFVDHLDKSEAVLAWQGFRPQARATLDAPVPYAAAYYRTDGGEIMRRLQPDFARALAELSGKDRPDGPARVLKFERPAR
jgi:hypothetical protein